MTRSKWSGSLQVPLICLCKNGNAEVILGQVILIRFVRFCITPEELVKSESVIGNSEPNKVAILPRIVINQLSEKLIEQYEERIKELKQIIADLKSK
jgi:hypothetical protein